MSPATDKTLQKRIIEMQIAEIQEAVKKAFAPRRISRSVAHGRALMFVNGAVILPARGKL